MADLTLPSGVRIARADEGEGPPVVLLHGWALAGGMLDGLARALAPGHRVIVPDLRGHGGSDPATPFGLPELAADLAGLLEVLDLRGAVLVGWSLGAQVALAALGVPAVRARVDRVALLAATPRFTAASDWPHGVPARAVEVIAHRLRREPARAFARFLADALSPAERAGPLAAAAEARRAALPLPDAGAALQGLAILARSDLRAGLPAIDLPALVIHGAEDPITPVGAGRALAAALPRGEGLELAGAGHLPFLSAPERVASALRAFLHDATRRGAGRAP